ncbi:unnamed protein product [marine sediment metagenome]|uniref:Uncharacterized protein n=1 Tax=marine sediment metagenome TaxID=412755 RepID=X1UBZ1_9ZZZZ
MRSILKFEEVEEKSDIVKNTISWIFKNIKFLLIPGSRLEELSRREFEYEKTISKRKFMRRLKSVLTILGIIIIFTIITFAIIRGVIQMIFLNLYSKNFSSDTKINTIKRRIISGSIAIKYLKMSTHEILSKIGNKI